MMDVFSRNLQSSMDQGIIRSFQCSRRATAVSHLLFADDVLIFTNGNVNSVKNLKKLLQEFCKASGQVVSQEKSKFFVHSKVSLAQCMKLHQVLNFQQGSLPTKYLGVPLYCGRTKAVHFDFILDKIRTRISGWRAKMLSWGGKITVINSILNSIPIYALSVLPVPKKTINNIQKCISDFLWNQGDQRRMHWVAWHKVVKPIDEGGLNLKLLAESSYFWRSKLAWSFLQKRSLWSRFMNQKYKRGTVSRLDSKLWKELVPLISQLSSECFWKLGKGHIFFWSQRWWPMDLNINHQTDLPDIFIADVWSDISRKALYIAALPEELQQFARNLALNTEEDVLVWKGSDSGVFCSREFRFQHSPAAVVRSAWWNKFWQPWIPTKISCFLWRCLNNAVPVDEAVQRARVPFVSKCVCCTVGHQETLHHLFLEGEAARAVWNFMQGIFDVNSYSYSFSNAAAHWIQNTSTVSQFGCLKILAFALTVWELWKWRNKTIFDQPEDQSSIKRRIIYQIQQLNCLIVPKRNASWREELAISCLHIPSAKVKKRPGQWVKWTPNSRDLTVNVHVKAKENSYQGSCVIRNNQGSLFWCFNRNFLGLQDYFQALSRILLEALVIVQNSGLRIAEIQSVDGKFIDCLGGRRSPPWRWESQIQELRDHCGGIVLNRIDKERNAVAVVVAEAEQAASSELRRLAEVRRLLQEDSTGMARWLRS